ncbi:MAG: DUF1294 domain-containing protein [Pseudomonadota bacterium]
MNRLFPLGAMIALIAVTKACIAGSPTLVLSYLVIISVVTMLANWLDKRNAEKGQWRLPEAQLHLLELAGGWPSAYLAQRWFHHKTQKQSYRITFWMIVLLHCLIALDYLLDWRILGAIRSFL